MTNDLDDQLQELCTHASSEQDGSKLLELHNEICRLIGEKYSLVKTATA